MVKIVVQSKAISYTCVEFFCEKENDQTFSPPPPKWIKKILGRKYINIIMYEIIAN